LDFSFGQGTEGGRSIRRVSGLGDVVLSYPVVGPFLLRLLHRASEFIVIFSWLDPLNLFLASFSGSGLRWRQ